jgi:hypothetical protein
MHPWNHKILSKRRFPPERFLLLLFRNISHFRKKSEINDEYNRILLLFDEIFWSFDESGWSQSLSLENFVVP